MSVIPLGYDSQECIVFKVKPRRIFLPIDVSKKEAQERSFFIKNKTTQLQKVTFDDPITQFFEIHKFSREQRTIPPEKSLEVRVKGCGTLAARPYYDVIKVTCSKGCESYVGVTASPTIRDTLKIPFDINLGTVPLGEKAVYNFKIPVMKNKTPFLFLSSIYNPDLTITPMKGLVWKEPKTVFISYLPRGYVTLSHPIHLYLPSVSVLPLMIYVTADTKPGKLSEMIRMVDDKTKSKFKMKLPFVRIPQNDEIMTKPPIQYDGSQHRTNLYLLKKDEKKGAELDLLGPLGRSLNEEEEIKKMKQLNFFKDLLSLRKSSMEPLSHNKTVLKQLIIDDVDKWDAHWKAYEEILSEKGKCDEDMKEPLLRRRRLIKSSIVEEDIICPPDVPNLWLIRQQILNKFIEAARRIIIHHRLLSRLKALKRVRQRQEIIRRGTKMNIT